MAKLALIWFILEVAGLKPANAAVMPFVHPLFSSPMVLQRDASDPVWGWMTSGETVTAMVKDQNGNTLQTKTAVARAEGRWQANVEPFVLVTPERITFAAPWRIACPGVSHYPHHDREGECRSQRREIDHHRHGSSRPVERCHACGLHRSQ